MPKEKKIYSDSRKFFKKESDTIKAIESFKTIFYMTYARQLIIEKNLFKIILIHSNTIEAEFDSMEKLFSSYYPTGFFVPNKNNDFYKDYIKKFSSRHFEYNKKSENWILTSK